MGIPQTKTPTIPKVDYTQKLQIMLLGDDHVGKTSIVSRYVDQVHREEYIGTIGCNIETSSSYTLLGQSVLFYFWDTSGLERFRSVIGSAVVYKVPNCMLCFDVSNRGSFDALRGWIEYVYRFQKDIKQLVIVGNKIDVDVRSVSRDEGEKLAAEFGLNYYEVSARTGEGVEEMFYNLGVNILQDINDRNVDR